MTALGERPVSSLNRREALATTIAGGLFASVGVAQAAVADRRSSDLDAIVREFQAAFDIPGMALAVLTPGAAPLLRTYGLRSLGRPEPVDTRTLFAIGSNSKAFTAAALAILVDEGKLGWDDPVTRHLPEFRMSDPAVTGMMTVRDLLVHRSGLTLGAGDLMQFPPTDHSAAELLAALAHFPLGNRFRAAYAYDNILYIVAGMVVARVSGQSWDGFVASRIFAPLGMRDAVPNVTLVTVTNRAGRHARLGPPVRGLGKVRAIEPAETALIGPAGGINASISAIVPWLAVQLAQGQVSGRPRVWSRDQAAEMWKAQTLISSGPGPGGGDPSQPVLNAYALGWGISDYRGRRMVSHAGGVAGQSTRIALLPDQGIALAIFTNSEEGDAISALRYALLDHLLGAPARDWLGDVRKAQRAQAQEVAKIATGAGIVAPSGGPTLPLPRYAGRYRDAWYGDILVRQGGRTLSIDFTRTPLLKSELTPFGPDTFRTWMPTGVEDAVVRFVVENGRVDRLELKALSPLADFSFDYQDLRPVRLGR